MQSTSSSRLRARGGVSKSSGSSSKSGSKSGATQSGSNRPSRDDAKRPKSRSEPQRCCRRATEE